MRCCIRGKYTEQNYKRNTCFCLHFLWAELKDLLCTQKAYFSQIMFTNLSKSVLVSFSFAEIIHPPHRCGISRCWLDSMIIGQVCLRLATIKGHSKKCIVLSHSTMPQMLQVLREHAIIMLSNQYLDIPHLWGGRIISAKEKCSLTQI